MDPEQTAPSLIWVHTVCHRGFFNISADEKKQTTFVAIGALRGTVVIKVLSKSKSGAVYRASYVSAHVLLHLFNELGK